MGILERLKGKKQDEEPDVIPDEYEPELADIPEDVKAIEDDDIMDFVKTKRETSERNIQKGVKQDGEKVKPQAKAVQAQKEVSQVVAENKAKEVQEAEENLSSHTSSISINVTESNLEKTKDALDSFIENGYVVVVLAEKKEHLFND